MVRPCAAVVHRCLNRQARQAIPNTALRVLVMVFVTPAGQVRVPAAESWVKSSMVNPPQRLLVAGEDPHRVHPAGDQGVTDADLDRPGGPLHREVVPDAGGAVGFAERDEVSQQLAQPFDLEAHRAAHRQVVVDAGPERAHGRVPGHGRAKLRAASSTGAPLGAVPGQGRDKGRNATSSTLA